MLVNPSPTVFLKPPILFNRDNDGFTATKLPQDPCPKPNTELLLLLTERWRRGGTQLKSECFGGGCGCFFWGFISGTRPRVGFGRLSQCVWRAVQRDQSHSDSSMMDEDIQVPEIRLLDVEGNSSEVECLFKEEALLGGSWGGTITLSSNSTKHSATDF